MCLVERRFYIEDVAQNGFREILRITIYISEVLAKMRKIILLGLLGSLTIPVHAQSSVTLYGRFDNGFDYINGLTNSSETHTNRFRAQSGDWGASLFGIKGAEDIGDGIKVLFHLESLMNTTNGTVGSGGSFFDRYATVGVSHPSYGTFLMGRQLSLINNSWDFDPFGQTSWSSFSLVRGRNVPLASNSVSYDSPKIFGFEVSGQYSLSNATNWNGNGTTTQGRADAAQLTYTSALFQIRGIYDEIRNPANGRLDDVFHYSRGYFGGLNIFLGPVKISTVYQTFHADSAPAVNQGVTSLRQVWGGVAWQATDAAALNAAVYHVNANNSGGNATIYALGGSYNLSKRTLVDAEIATIHNSSTANFGLEANPAGPGGVTATGMNDNPQPGHSQTGVFIGMQHTF
jgi:predicted porin